MPSPFGFTVLVNWSSVTSKHYFSDFRRAQAQKRNHGDALAVRG
jgi:hypothetical protein